MAYELDVVALSAGLFTAAGVGLKSLWDRVWSRRDRKEERDAARDEAHRNELRRAYIELITSFHKLIDDAFAVAATFEEHDRVRKAMLAAKLQQQLYPSAATASIEVGPSPFDEVDQRAKRARQSFIDSMSDVLGKASSVRLLDETGRGTKVWKLLKEPFPSLMKVEDAEEFRVELRARRRGFDELIDDLDGAFAPRRWDERLLPPTADKGQGQLPSG